MKYKTSELWFKHSLFAKQNGLGKAKMLTFYVHSQIAMLVLEYVLLISEWNVWNVQNLLRGVKISFLPTSKKVLRLACIANKHLRGHPWH